MFKLNQIPSNIAWYLSGFVDGEGSFNISFRKKSDYRIGWQPVLSFNVSQRERTVLALMKRHFKCGIIKARKDGVHSYDVTNPKALQENIIPFFKKYNFLSQRKKYNFSLFKKAVKLMAEKRHLEPKGLKELVNIREKINPGA
ncbi:LAGLIDADG family homing endonuclease, partial [Patescibacteria group bacterium]|nr:LAGLIDADG family homing endonuclease [Patescibacteria group bacterium]